MSGVETQLRRMVKSQLDRDYAGLQRLYEQLHANPELSLHERKTSRRVAVEFKNAGLSVTENFGGFGVVGVFRNGSGPTVLLRTDMDALPIREKTNLPYASKIEQKNDAGELVPVMHACGHDAHMTSLVGAVGLLVPLRSHWKGTLIAIGQPAEERLLGAKAMLKAGLFSRFPKPDCCVGLHVSPTLPTGTIGFTEGYMLSNVNSVNVTVRGMGGHGAFPHKTKDPIVLAAQIVLALQTIASREISPTEQVVVTVGAIHGGAHHNIIPDEVKLQLTVRCYSDEVRKLTLNAIRRITHGLAQAAGIPKKKFPLVEILDESTDATYNDPELTRNLVSSFRNWFGASNVVPQTPVMGGEDFAMYGRTKEKIPISFFWLGAGDRNFLRAQKKKGESVPQLHSCYFHPVPEQTIKTGANAFCAAALRIFNEQKAL